MPSRANFLTAVASKKIVRLIPSENKRTQLCLQIELAEEKSQSLHSQKSPQWAEKMYFKKKENRYFEWYKNMCMQTRNILTNLSPNPAWPEKPGPTYNSGPSMPSRSTENSYVDDYQVDNRKRSSAFGERLTFPCFDSFATYKTYCRIISRITIKPFVAVRPSCLKWSVHDNIFSKLSSWKWFWLIDFIWHQFLCCSATSKIRSFKQGYAPVSPAALFLCSTARIRQDISAASFCSCKLVCRTDECALLPCCNALPDIFAEMNCCVVALSVFSAGTQNF